MRKPKQVGLGEHLRLKRERLNFNQALVAKNLDLSKSYISRIERGKRAVSLELLAKYADLFGMEAWELLAEYEQSISGQSGAGPGKEK